LRPEVASYFELQLIHPIFSRQPLLKLALKVGRAFQPDKMAASVADPGSFGHREMTALLNWKIFLIEALL
jgi:hypothetical protein